MLTEHQSDNVCGCSSGQQSLRSPAKSAPVRQDYGIDGSEGKQGSIYRKIASFALRSSDPDGGPQIKPAEELHPTDHVS